MNKKFQLVVDQDSGTANKGKATVLLAKAAELLEAGDFRGAAEASKEATLVIGGIAQENTSDEDWLERMTEVKPEASKADPERSKIAARLKGHAEEGTAAPLEHRAHVARLLTESATKVLEGGFDFETFTLKRTLAIADCYQAIAHYTLGGVAEREAKHLGFLQQAVDKLEAGDDRHFKPFTNSSNPGFASFLKHQVLDRNAN